MEKERLEQFRIQLLAKKEEIANEAGKTLSEMTDPLLVMRDPALAPQAKFHLS